MQMLKYFSSNKNIRNSGHFILLLTLSVMVLSCNPTKYVPEGESLLDNNFVVINQEDVKKADITPYIKQQPNKRIFGARFHLGLYNLSNIEKEKWPHNWLRNIGEEPVIFDQDATTKSKDQIESYLSSKGYFDGQVMETIESANQKSKVYFNIDLKPAYTIRNLYYEIADTNLSPVIYSDTTDCLIEKGKPYDVDVLQSEQSRLERFISDLGFYNFSGDDIYFRVDSTVGDRQVDIYYGIRNYTYINRNNMQVTGPHRQYKVRNIYIYPEYYPREVLSGGEDYIETLDTVSYNGYYFISNVSRPTIKYDIIIQSLYIRPGITFVVSNSERSQAHLMSLKTYRLVNIRYLEPDVEVVNSDGTRALDCIIQLTPMSRQSFSVELEGTNSGGNLGGALNFVYQNKNLFHGAEQFNLKLKGAYETFSQTSGGIRSTKEFGIETSLKLPKFLVPFMEGEGFVRRYNPTSSIQAAYNRQILPVYTRTVANTSFGYVWNAGSYRTHMINPFQLNLVKIPVIDDNYRINVIDKSDYLKNSYKDVLISGGSYSYIFNNQNINKSVHSWFIRINTEASGNLLYAIKKLSGASFVTDSLSSHYNFLGQPFAQFVRFDVDARYTRVINEVSSIVYRGFGGVGIPYRNSAAMPFEKQYFEGGANGIRGWQVRSLGPGSLPPPDSTTYFNQTGDIKLEVNVEYRFKLFWILEGAVFVDAGNIWAIREDPDRPGAQFRFNKFLDDVAIGTGFGMRFDLQFVLLRTDFGFKLRDPQYTGDSKWIIFRPSDKLSKNFAMVIGIGYPF